MTDSGTQIWRLATALSGALTPVDVAVALAEAGAVAAGAAFANMAVRDDHGTWVIHGATLADALADRWRRLEPTESTPLGDAIRDGTPVLLSSIEAIAAAYPALVDDTVAAGLAATASLPLLSAQGGAAGAAGFGWNEAQAFDAEQRRTLELISQMAASALERAILHQRYVDSVDARDVAEAQLLQEIFLPRTLPKVQNLEAAAVYVPAADAAMGGDWYDVFAIEGGRRSFFVVGDVGGHGLAAAAVMAQLRNAARGFAVEHSSPAVVMRQLNRMLCELEPTETASAIVMLWDPEREITVRANAGHPPILRCRPGEFGFLDPDVTGSLLGADPDATYRSEEKQLRRDTTLLFYTDGLIEQRGENLDQGMAALLAYAEGLSDLSPRALCDAVLEWRLGYGPSEDDVCVLAVRLD